MRQRDRERDWRDETGEREVERAGQERARLESESETGAQEWERLESESEIDRQRQRR